MLFNCIISRHGGFVKYSLEKFINGYIHDVTYENSQARERTQVLMDKANQLSGIVIGTGDLFEFVLGWAVYNGDHFLS